MYILLICIFMIHINASVPDIEVEAFHNEKIRKTKLSDYRGKWVALVFYPADFTFVCPTELQELAMLYPEFQKVNAEVLSVSCDTVFVHKAWHDNSETIKQIQFPMLADPTRQMADAFGVLIPDQGLALRGTFVIDPDGVLKAYEVHDNSVGRSAGELLRKIQAAQFVREHNGEVCPASWKPGAKTLKPGLDLVGKL